MSVFPILTNTNEANTRRKSLESKYTQAGRGDKGSRKAKNLGESRVGHNTSSSPLNVS